jgi:hypothetical protein
LAETVHRCDPDRLTDFRLFGLRQQIADFEPELHRFLSSPRGRFATWLAARDVAAGT